MRAGGGDPQADALGRVGEVAADADDFFRELVDAGTDLRSDLDDRLVHLAPDAVAECWSARRQELRHMRPELPRVRIDDLKLLLDTDGEGMVHGRRLS
jgi:hypothetical protein